MSRVFNNKRYFLRGKYNREEAQKRAEEYRKDGHHAIIVRLRTGKKSSGLYIRR